MRHLVTALALFLAACTGAADTEGLVAADSSVAAPEQPAAPTLVCWTSTQSGESGLLSFEEETDSYGLVEALLGLKGHAAAVGDVNGDNLPDLMVGTFGDRPHEDYAVRGATGPNPDRLVVSTPDLTLDDDWAPDLARTSGALFADLDGDGDDDLVLIRHGGVGGNAAGSSWVFENEEGKLTRQVEVISPGFRGRTPTVADFDGDGLLDVYVSEDKYGETGGVLLRNDGDLQFTDVTSESGLAGMFSLAAVAADLNHDSRPDLVVSRGVFLNQGGFSFDEVTPDGFVTEPVTNEDDPAGVAVGDLNGDHWPDIVVGQHFTSTREQGSLVPISIFLNSGDPAGVGFEEHTEASEVEPLPILAPHVHIADLDNDGDLDIVTSASTDGGTRPAFFVNDGSDKPNFATSGPLDESKYWVGAPVLDVNRDGRLDVFAVEWESSQPSLLWVNKSASGHWLEVSVAGPGRGVGSVVEVSTLDGQVLGRQEIIVATGYSSAHSPVAHFGLGEHEQVEVSLQLPGGEIHDLGAVPVDSHIRWPAGCD